jgi:hypothetical protein
MSTPRQKELKAGQSSVIQESDNKAYLHPDSKYVKSEEGVTEYRKAKVPYPDTYIDKAYQQFLDRTPDEEGNDFRHKNHTRVTKIGRVRLPGGKEYLLWDEVQVRFTPLGNPERFALTNLGCYPIIVIRREMIQESNGLKRVIMRPSDETITGYSLEYSVENIDRLHKDANDNADVALVDEDSISNPTTQYILHSNPDRGNERVSIEKWEDFRDGDFMELFEYGQKITSDKEAEDIKAKQSKRS